jgi:hypothetical protein
MGWQVLRGNNAARPWLSLIFGKFVYLHLPQRGMSFVDGLTLANVF